MILPLVPFFLRDIESCVPRDGCTLIEGIKPLGGGIGDEMINGTCTALAGATECEYIEPASQLFVGLILSAQYTGVVIGSVFWGRLSDFFGVRLVYLILLGLDTVLFALSAVMTSAVGLLIVRLCAGFCAIMPLGSAWVSATAPPDKQMQAFTFLFISIIGGFVSGAHFFFGAHPLLFFFTFSTSSGFLLSLSLILSIF